MSRVCFSADEQQLFAVTAEKGLAASAVDILGERSDQPLDKSLLPYSAVYDIATNATGDRVAFALKWGAVVLHSQDRRKLLDVRYPQVHAVRFSDDGALLAVAGHDGRIAVLRAM